MHWKPSETSFHGGQTISLSLESSSTHIVFVQGLSLYRSAPFKIPIKGNRFNEELLGVSEFVLYAIGHERNLAEEVGYPPRVCRWGKPRQRSAFERGRGKYSPHAGTGRVTARAMKRKGNGVRL